MRHEGSVGHEWEADRRPRYGSVPCAVNAASHLWRVSPCPGAGSTRVVPFQHAWPPLSSSDTPNPRLGATGFDQGGSFQGWRICLFRLTNGPQQSWALSSAHSLTGGSQVPGVIPLTSIQDQYSSNERQGSSSPLFMWIIRLVKWHKNWWGGCTNGRSLGPSPPVHPYGTQNTVFTVLYCWLHCS
jgi:hypothetical protein